MPGTDLAYGSIYLCSFNAMSGTDLAYGSILRPCYAMSGTDLARPGLEYIVDTDHNKCEPCPVKSECDGYVKPPF
eukprot:3273494-Rhodomonas_salina.1